MAWHVVVWQWLAHAAVGSFLILGIGGLVVRWCRQPVNRLRVIELALVGCLIAPWLSLLPGVPHWSAGLLESTRVADEVPAAQPSAPEPVAVASGTPQLPPLPPAEAAVDAKPVETAVNLPAPSPETPAEAVASTSVAPQQAALTPTVPTPLLIVLAYLGAVAVLSGWWLLGVGKLLYLHWTARPAPQQIVELFRDVAGPAADGIGLLISDQIELPLTFRWWRSAILLPATLCEGGDPAALRYCLAHEWSHIERRDLWTWHMAMAAQFLFFYQPLFWWLRRQLRLCQDYLADARAAEQAPLAEDYAEYLVALAQRRLGAPALAALGIGDRRSNLYRRITMLLNTREPLQRRCRGLWTLAVVLAAGAVLALVGAVRLDAGDPPAKEKADAKKETAKEPAKEANKGETLKYTGKVTDKDTGKGIQGATVTVRRSLLGDPRTPGNKIVQETKHQTDANGKYSFTIPPEQSAERYLYIELDVEHTDYAAKTGFGYALSMILKNQKMGGRPFFENVDLRPGKPVTGRVETPDGKPAAGVEVLAYSVTDKPGNGFFEFGSFARAKTDQEGRFRIVMVTPGRAVFWLLPEKYAPSLHVVKNNKRGDLGVFGLEKGISVKGKVVDVKGKPLAGIYVNIERERGPGDEELAQIAVANSIRRGAVTNNQGEFDMAPLPAGEYRIKPDEHNYDPIKHERTTRPLPAVFVRQKVTLKEGEMPDPIEVRAVPTVTIEAQYLDSKGKPTRGHECHIFGRMDNDFWFGQGRPDADGKIIALVPHGLKNVQLDLMTNEHGVLRHRMNPASPLQNNRRVDLGVLNQDVKGIQIIRYVAPIAIVKVVAKDMAKLKDVVVTGEYPPGKAQFDRGGFIAKKGLRTDVHWEQQEDGRFRSSQLFPDEEVTITAHADGYKPRSEKITLKEGATKDLTLTLEK